MLPHHYRRAVLHRDQIGVPPGPGSPLQIEDLASTELAPGHLRLKVRACAVCRTDLHICAGELEPRREALVPGHQIVGEVVDGATVERPLGMRVGVSWLGGTDGTCWYCGHGCENLCDHPQFTGYDLDGGYGEYVDARVDFTHPLPDQLDDLHAAPLLCAGVIGFRALRVAGVQHGERVGLYGYGASAHLMLPLLQAWGCQVYVATRGPSRRRLAQEMGATWVGDATERPAASLDRAITFAPAGDVVVAALAALRKGGVVAINAIHLDRVPEFDYDSLLWGERQLRSVANMTRDDARDFLAIAQEIGLRPRAQAYPLDKVNEALAALAADEITGAAVVLPQQ